MAGDTGKMVHIHEHEDKYIQSQLVEYKSCEFRIEQRYGYSEEQERQM